LIGSGAGPAGNGQRRSDVDILKRIANGVLCLFIAGAALAMTADAWHQLATSGELPIHARHGSGTVAPFTLAFFAGLIFYALLPVIAAGCIIALIDQQIGIPFAERHRRSIRRSLAMLFGVSVLTPILIALMSTPAPG
jgi:hypothetical protein